MGKTRRKRHENPIEFARSIRSTAPSMRASIFSQRRSTTYTYERIGSATVFLPGMDTKLTDAQAPAHVVRWCAWGKLIGNRILRLALALHVRRALDHVGQASSGMSWVANAEQNICETIFLECPSGKATLDWINSTMYKAEYQDNKGNFLPRFWIELERKVANAIPLDEFLCEIEKRVADKPKRNPPKNLRKRELRTAALPKEVSEAVRVLAAYEAEQRSKTERKG